MRDRVLNVKWANKVLKSKNFVVLTDKESMIALKGVDPDSLDDIFILQSQQAAINQFIDSLENLRKRHERRVQELGVNVGVKRMPTRRKAAKKANKARRN